ncbi:MAG: phage terminase large subunit family protein [Deltaproteobacteria bacterium]|nr:phage terminase large subunit family protein [Deltaproteobacteria bacterium]
MSGRFVWIFERTPDLKAPYRSGEIPEGVIILTAGVDVQKNRVYYAVRGWGAASESWLIENGGFYGDTDQPDVWRQLSLILESGVGDFNIRKL